MTDSSATLTSNARRALWLVAGGIALAMGIVGVFMPVLPTVPFVLLAAMCFSRGCARCERWLLEHPRFGPPLREWRAHHAVSRRAKWLATLSMAGGSAIAWVLLSGWPRWLPAAVCAVVAAWLWRRPEPSKAAGREGGAA